MIEREVALIRNSVFVTGIKRNLIDNVCNPKQKRFRRFAKTLNEVQRTTVHRLRDALCPLRRLYSVGCSRNCHHAFLHFVRMGNTRMLLYA